MPFSYHKPTSTKCELCDELNESDQASAIIDSHSGKASSANNFPFHNWYNFVLGYSPEFPMFMIEREKIVPTDTVLDPFMGTGTTLVCCKSLGIPSQGIDANDFMVDVARAKLNWQIDVRVLRNYLHEIVERAEEEFSKYNWYSSNQGLSAQLPLTAILNDGQTDVRQFVAQRRPKMLEERYISNKPLAKAYIIGDLIDSQVIEPEVKHLFEIALTAIIVPISNIRYGPGFGVVKPKEDVDVLKIFTAKISTIIKDIEQVTPQQKRTRADVVLGDSRSLGSQFAPNSVKLMITSPPYPGDHEYTKHTRLELIFRGYARNLNEFRTIKQRLLCSSTTNLYKDDDDKLTVLEFESIQNITALISSRLERDKATSGFEKLYTKLVWEYFGGMYKTLSECFHVLQSGGKIALLVSDSHAFKMVHIQTAEILQEIGLKLGYVTPEIILWQRKSTTSHAYMLLENVLILTKP